MKEKIYHDKYVQYYDYFQQGVRGDVGFYLSHFKNFRGSVLEIGAGTGRITTPLMKAGINVTALDSSADMLAILKKKAKPLGISPRMIHADMRTMRIAQKFDAVIVTFRAFQHLYTARDQLAALHSIRKHLKPRGVLIFDVYAPSIKYMAEGTWKWFGADKKILPGTKRKVVVDLRNRYDFGNQIMYQEYRFTYPNGKRDILPLRMRFFFRFEVGHLLHRTGFSIIKLLGDFKGHPYKHGSPEMIWICRPSITMPKMSGLI